jgi:uncharacterized protein YidB (DUF937 family)
LTIICGAFTQSAAIGSITTETIMAKGYPSMLALLGLVAVAGYQNREKIAEMVGKLGQDDPQHRQSGQPAGVDRTHGPLGGVGDVLKNGLDELVDRFKQNGRGDVAQSWVNHGPNQDIAPHELRDTLGPDALASLSQRTGLTEDELLTRLSQQLPSAIDRYTPEGRLPG